jgi:uncharacterized protein YcaQ
VLRVPGAFAELGVAVDEVAEALAAELSLMADWLQLDTVEVGARDTAARGDLAWPLQQALGHYARQR